MALSRRRILQGAAGAGLVAAVPAGFQLSWSQRDFSRDGYSPDYPDAPSGEESWMNWSGIERATPQSIASPATEQQLANMIKGTRSGLRPVGSGHSFTGLATSEGVMVDCSGFKGLMSYDPKTGLATFGAGTLLFEAAEALSKVGRAFANLSDIDVQTLAGAFSTATHGTGSTLTALHDYIVGFRIITPAGEILDVSKNRHPELFAAGKVSLGALGIITQYTLNTVPAFNLHRQMTIEKVGPFLDKVGQLASTHRNFEFFYAPGSGYIAWLTHDTYEGPIPERPIAEEDDSLDSLKELRDIFGWWPWLRRQILQAAFPTGLVEDVRDASWQLLATTRPQKFIEMEYHLPRDKGVETFKTIFQMLDQRKDAFFPIEYRHIAADDAWLSPFNAGPRASIAIHADASERYDYFFADFEPIFKAAGGRPHWGKLHSLGRTELTALYPKYDQFLALRRQLDPTGKFLNSHLAKLFGESFNA